MGQEVQMIKSSDSETPLEYDEIKGLIPTHITTKGELDTLEFGNMEDYDYGLLLKFVRS